MGHIFISYSHKDKEYVEKLAQKLIYEGFKVWIDHRIDYGSEWTNEIEQAIDTCDAYIVVMTRAAKESQWVQREVIHAEKRRKPFFPLLLSGEAWFSLGNIQYFDVTDSSLPQKKYYRHLATVAERKGWTSSAPKPVATKKHRIDKTPLRKKSKGNLKIVYALITGVSLFIAGIFGLPLLMSSPGQTPVPLEIATETPSVIRTLTLTSAPVTTDTPTQMVTVTHIPSAISPTVTLTETLTPIPVITYTPVSTSTPLFSDYKTVIHLGDEDNFVDWEELTGECYEIVFSVDLPIQTLSVRLEVFDTDAENPIILNDKNVAYTPAQNQSYSGSWSDTLEFRILNADVRDSNLLKICTTFALNPDKVGDLDDFQIRNIEIIVER